MACIVLFRYSYFDLFTNKYLLKVVRTAKPEGLSLLTRIPSALESNTVESVRHLPCLEPDVDSTYKRSTWTKKLVYYFQTQQAKYVSALLLHTGRKIVMTHCFSFVENRAAFHHSSAQRHKLAPFQVHPSVSLLRLLGAP